MNHHRILTAYLKELRGITEKSKSRQSVPGRDSNRVTNEWKSDALSRFLRQVGISKYYGTLQKWTNLKYDKQM
jgi:hypothetical protein